MTNVEFARIMFESDCEAGLYPKCRLWKDLPKDEKDIYLSEADCYIEDFPREEWPTLVLECPNEPVAKFVSAAIAIAMRCDLPTDTLEGMKET